MEDKVNKYKLLVKKYLSLDNVSVLAGAGTSWHLGAPTIRNIPEKLKKTLEKDIKKYFGEEQKTSVDDNQPVEEDKPAEKKDPSFEDLLNCLQADRFLRAKKNESTTDIDASIKKMQKWLFDKCNTEKTILETKIEKNAYDKLNNNRYHYHEVFIKKLLQRPANLKRVNLFTTNYDMAFDYALDNLGVHYINGFMGVHNRCFRPEVYDYDLYYPGQSVSGKVHRAEKVLKYFKIHGSLSWIATKPTANNIYGIKEIPLNDNFNVDKDNELIIYPCTSKKSFTLDLPYSELFRQFSKAINQPQSVLFCTGYSFNDEHINDIIKQAFTIPSFTLIVANYSDKADPDPQISKLRKLDDKRILILDEQDKEQSSFIGFVDNIMPDLYEEEENEMIAETLKRIYGNENSQNISSTTNESSVKNKELDNSIELKQESDSIETNDDLPF
ncbi:MAG: SIR2 family protein [Bacteroidales bacterium]|jgi:hypothetical protein